MQDRQSELDAIKRVDLSTIAASLAGFVVEKKRTTKKTVMMSNGADKIAISYNGRHYIFWTVGDNHRSGTAIDFVQHYVEQGASFGRVRQLLRPFLNAVYFADVRQQFKGKYAADIKENKVDLEAVARRYANFSPITHHHPYLCNVRGIPLKLLQTERLFGRVRQDRHGTVAFPHWGCPEGMASEQRTLTGYEMKSASIALFSSGGRKGLWSSAGMKGDHTIVVAESGIDALSYMALHGEKGVRVLSIAGNMNGQQPLLIRSAIERMGEGKIVAGFDNDSGGDKLCEQLETIVRGISHNSLILRENRPVCRGEDWNRVLQRQQGISPSSSHVLER